MIGSAELRTFSRTAPFWASLALVPVAWLGAIQGGWWILLMPLATWWLFTVLDFATGLELEDADPQTAEADLIWYRLVTLIWAPVQAITLFGLIAYVTWNDHLSTLEKLGVFFGMGILSGTIGIVYAHELMHQKNRWERWLGDILMAMALYGHFRSEHLLSTTATSARRAML